MTQLTQDNFGTVTDGKISLVEFFTTWCGPCKIQKQILQDIEKMHNISVGVVDLEENYNLADSCGITSVPTTLVYKNGKIHAKLIGLQQKEKINQVIASANAI